jgi:simple sugar transport system ATP-binding protein
VSAPLVRLEQVHKEFGAVVAVEQLTLSLAAGEIVALVGDNGAGKSTVVNCLAGVHAPTSGRILLEGEPVSFSGPLDARGHGIEVVPQDLALAGAQPVYMNVFLGRERVRGPLRRLDRTAMAAAAADLLDELDVRVASVRAPVDTLSGGQRQGVAIARAMLWAQRLVLMDEPTAALGVAETRRVEELIVRLRDRGKAILLVSHSLDQVLRLADRICVLRRGRQVGVVAREETSGDELVSMITGLR